jgi:myosin heavy subunit
MEKENSASRLGKVSSLSASRMNSLATPRSQPSSRPSSRPVSPQKRLPDTRALKAHRTEAPGCVAGGASVTAVRTSPAQAAVESQAVKEMKAFIADREEVHARQLADIEENIVRSTMLQQGAVEFAEYRLVEVERKLAAAVEEATTLQQVLEATVEAQIAEKAAHANHLLDAQRRTTEELARVVADHNIATAARHAELDALRGVCENRAALITTLQAAVDQLRDQVQELENLRQQAETQVHAAAAEERGRRSAELRVAREEARATVDAKTTQLAAAEEQLRATKDALADCLPSADDATEPASALATAKAVAAALASLQSERDEALTLLRHAQAEQERTAAALMEANTAIARRDEELGRLRGEATRNSVALASTRNSAALAMPPQHTTIRAAELPASEPPKVMSLREARAAYKLAGQLPPEFSTEQPRRPAAAAALAQLEMMTSNLRAPQP